MALRLADAIAIGLLWVVLTVAFEFGFGHYGAHKPWPELLADYKLARGRIWVLVLVTIVAAPYVTARLRDLS